LSTITLADVAAEASVHAATVSRAISRPDLVHPATLARVTEAIDRLGYVPNRAARQLAGGRTSTVAVLVPDIANPFFSTVVQAAQRSAAAADLLVLLADTAQQPRTELAAVASLAPNVDGLVLCSPVAPTGRLREAAGGRPLVFVNRRARAVASVSVDQGAVAALAVEHLRGLGHRRIGVVRGPAGYWSSAERERHLRRAGEDVVLLGPVEPTFEGGRAVLADALAAGVTAVAAFNDVMALGLLAAAAAKGVEVPGDLSVVGSDGVSVAAMATPALTTVQAPLEAVAFAAVDALLGCLAGDPPPTRVLDPCVVVRDSTAPAPVR
jgi:DNA-binding LacI/PurR family transcriptional regulator